MKRTFSHIVVGAGALGSAAAYRLARSGVTDVLVIEQFGLGHGQGASHDHSRIIRHSYHCPDYTALTRAAYDAWAEVEEEAGVTLVHRTGGLDLAAAGTAGEAELDACRRSLAPAGISSETLDAAEIRARWPQWHIADDVTGLYQQEGGILDIRKACAAHTALARSLGATFLPHTTVRGLTSSGSHVRVATDQGTFTAESVILCAASWLPALLPGLGLDWNLTLSQEQVSYFTPRDVSEFTPEHFPVWIWHGDQVFYGFPAYGERAVKAARDMSGRFVTQETRTPEPDAQETALVSAFLREQLPSAAGPELYSRTCIYDMPPDRDFIIDLAPGHPRIAVAIGAGHAGKFASLIGTILADLTTRGATHHPIDRFRADRPALTDPAYTPAFRLTGGRQPPEEHPGT